MNDLLIAVTTAAVIVFVYWSLRRVGAQRDLASRMDRLGFRPEKVGPGERKPLLGGVAARLARTSAGSKLESYAAKVHPHVMFSDVVALTLAGVLAGALAGGLLFGGSPLTLFAAAAGPVAVDRVVFRLGGRRLLRLENQLPEALALQSSALRAGHSTTRSLRTLAAEVKPPLGDEVARTIHEVDIGHAIDGALNVMRRRLGSRDVDLWVTAMLVHRLTGGNLASVLDDLATRIRERSHMKSEVRALTAQGRLSGIVVAVAPAAFFILLSVTSREEMKVLYTTPLGLLLLIAGIGMEAAGFLWIRWILRIKP